MSKDEHGNDVECEGIKQYKATSKEVSEIRQLIFTMSINSASNKTNLKNITVAFRELAATNRQTHIELFTRTENLKVDLAKISTSHNEHVKHDDQDDVGKFAYIMQTGDLQILILIFKMNNRRSLFLM